MAGEKVQSGNLRLWVDGEKIFDATGCTLDMTRETKQRAATKDTAAGAFTKSTRTFTAGYSGLITYAGDGNGGHDFSSLIDIFNDDSETQVTVEFVPKEADYTFYYTGTGIITAMGGVWNVDEDGTVSLTVSGGGISKVNKATTPPGGEEEED